MIINRGGEMPPLKKFQREDIVEAACQIAKDEGFQEVNARRIARHLHCSVQPIYHNFSTMDELKHVVTERIRQTYIQYMKSGADEELAYRGMGLSYIRFARDYPNYFKLLFMTESRLSPNRFIRNDAAGNDILRIGQKFSGLSNEEMEQFHLKVWLFTHGIAVMAATKTVAFSDGEIEELLSVTVKEMLIGFRAVHKQEEPV